MLRVFDDHQTGKQGFPRFFYEGNQRHILGSFNINFQHINVRNFMLLKYIYQQPTLYFCSWFDLLDLAILQAPRLLSSI